MSNVVPFNPLDKLALGESVADALEKAELYTLCSIEAFVGAGIYAIYYHGDFAPYKALSERNRNGINSLIPIYVGKAIPKGGRTGGNLSSPPGKVLYKRLAEHADSIRSASNLNIKDFSCRFLLVEDTWIPLGENLVISRYVPLWNKVVDGFGNHNPGKGRHKGVRPRWDVLHPGRHWAENLEPRSETQEQIAQEVVQFLSNNLI
ncbi:Eco29kI family restriction endonuclease [Oleiagrimonas soli]|uniref:Restriction endonuclease Eco29kI n=1 Tax=Oleiagrimonas soli TaxID=1543381 RepID=A0A841KHY3_9GAMM|nr:Eco29kI family restriction endonuclease [Oleiagrimonas soli]MBB6184786.1 hypothetical protein [Oleiagrimonas soli]